MRPLRRESPRVRSWATRAHHWAKSRARSRGLKFTLTVEWIIDQWIGRCPALGLVLAPAAGRAAPNSPSLDRLVPSRGYVPGNVAILSNRANEIKRDASLRELGRVVAWMQRPRRRTPWPSPSKP
jgi:hypothetical protein